MSKILSALWLLSACDGKSPNHPASDRADSDCEFADWYADADQDGYGDENAAISACEQPEGYMGDFTDCDDSEPGVHPGADEVCNEVDDNCDGEADEGLPTDTWYADSDEDGYGDPNGSVRVCAQPEGTTDNNDDCNDADATAYPGAPDSDCDGVTHDCENPEDDGDADGVLACDGDCDDGNVTVFPGAVELCDGEDNDCDGVTPADEGDVDADGYLVCEGDCDDTRADVRPTHLEFCDAADNDCDGDVDEACVTCSWGVPDDFATIQEAVDAAVEGDVVCVQPGTYSASISFGPVDISLVSLDGAESTILSGGEVVIDGGSEAMVMDGFTIQDCTWTYYGAVALIASDATLQNLIISGNINDGFGVGGLGIWGGSPTVRHTRISDNQNMESNSGLYIGAGGGVAMSGASPLFDDVVISGNQAGNQGGGVLVSDSTPTFLNVRIEGNSTDNREGGGGVYASVSTLTFLNSTVVNNEAHTNVFVVDYYGWGSTYVGDGAGFYLSSSTLSFTNGVIADNVSDGGKGGAFYLADSSITVTNTVVSANSAVAGSVIWSDGGTATLQNSAVSDNPGGQFGMIVNPLGAGANLTVDPQFLDGDYHLEANSPLVDAGSSLIFDPDGSVSDIGVFGGPEAGRRDSDWDGDDIWWMPGTFDAGTSAGLDCDDDNDSVTASSGCSYTAPDADGDGYGSDDCDDADPAVHPGAIDICDGVDSDCDGVSEADGDGDGYLACDDCEDTEAGVHPGAVELTDGFDTDCDGVTPSDERDEDGDGTVADDDCDDTSWTRSPGNFELCNGLDEDCDGEVDEDCVTCDILVPTEQPTVQEGVWAASGGETVCVYPGTYSQQVSFDGVDVNLVGLGGSGETVLDGDGGAPVLSILSGETSSVAGFTITGAQNGPAVEVSGSTLTFSDLQVVDNDNGLSPSGGGFSLSDSSVTITSATISGNSDVSFGGTYGVTEYGGGGGIYASNTDLSLLDVVVSGNYAGASGGGLYVADSTLVLSNVWISDNVIDYLHGGAIYAYNSVLALTNTTVSSNSARSCMCYYEKDETYTAHATNPGLYASGGSVGVTNSVFADNDYWSGITLVPSLEVSGATLDVVNTVLLGDTAEITADSIQNSNVWGRTSTTFAEAGADGNISVDPVFYDAWLHLDASSPLVEAGTSSLLDPDGSNSDIGMYGGPDAGGLDADGDGWANWWLAGPYDAATSSDFDCDDSDASVWPGNGC